MVGDEPVDREAHMVSLSTSRIYRSNLSDVLVGEEFVCMRVSAVQSLGNAYRGRVCDFACVYL